MHNSFIVLLFYMEMERALIDLDNESEESEEEIQEFDSRLMVKPKTKSAVWNYFRVESDSNGHPINQFVVNVWSLLLLVTETLVIFSLIYAVSTCYFMLKCMTKGEVKRKAAMHRLRKPTIEYALSLSQKYNRKGKK